MAFASPHWLFGLFVLPMLLVLEIRAIGRAGKRLERLVGSREGHALLMQRRPRERWQGMALRLTALTLLMVGAAGPEWGREVVRRNATGSDVTLVVDVSASMDARDVVPSRLDEARREALAVMDHLAGSRVGVVAFAGDAIRLCPLTLDRASARLVVESLSSGSVSDPGTDIGRALRMAMRVLPGGHREEQAIVLWTDGEDLEQNARAAIDDVARAGVRVFTVGVGTPSGDVIPVLDNDGRVTDVKRDENGNVVRSRLDENLLRTIARRTRGVYFVASRPGGQLPRLLSALGSVARAAKGQRLVERPVARFPLLAAGAVVLLGLERLRLRRRRESVKDETPLHEERTAAAAVAILMTLFLATPARAQSAWARGDRAFKAGRYAEAESLYAIRLRHGGPVAVRVNRATARGLRGGTDEASHELAGLAARDDRIGRTAGYNLGTLLGEKREYDPALAALRRVIERDPRDEEARWNYEVLARREQEEKNPPPKPPPPTPRPQPSGGGGGGQGPSQPQPAPSGTAPANPAGTPPTPQAGGSMSRSQAEQILNALEEMARMDQQRQHRVRVQQEKRGRDW